VKTLNKKIQNFFNWKIVEVWRVEKKKKMIRGKTSVRFQLLSVWQAPSTLFSFKQPKYKSGTTARTL